MTAEPGINSVVAAWRPPTLVSNVEWEAEVLMIGYRLLRRSMRLPAREYRRTRFKLPGGGARRGETPRQAAVREMQEETGLRPRDKTKMFEVDLGVYETPAGLEHKFGHIVPRAGCNGRLRKLPVPENKSLIVAYRWVPISEAMHILRPVSDNTSQFDLLAKAKLLLAEPGLIPPKTPQVA